MRIAFVLAALLAFGCASASSNAPTSAIAADDGLLDSLLASGEYRGASFTQMNATPFASAIDGSLVLVYVSNDAASAYAAVTPESPVAGAPFPVGGIVVREVLDEDGGVGTITVMAKRESGYFPVVGDFFFGVSAPDGTPRSDDDGNPLWGRVSSCTVCHTTRAAAGYLFGVSHSQRH